MSHFSDELWADWARGLLNDDQRAEMAGHLERGCSDCQSASETWSNVAQFAARDADYEPPGAVVDRAHGLFEKHAPRKPRLLDLPQRTAELLYDSFQNPLPAGIRSLARATRHLSYKAGSFFIDVRIEEAATARGEASVVGQLMRRPDQPTLPIEGMSVVLTSGKSTMAETTTNRFGEFAFEMDTDRDNNLAIGVSDDFAVVVPLTGKSKH